MYKVYLVVFEKQNSIYVGCTNNLRRRKDQHNDNARKRRSQFGIFLSDNGIVLSEENMTVLKTFKDRKLALTTERKTVLAFNKSGFNVINDNYSLHCSRKYPLPSAIDNTKNWIIVDYMIHEAKQIRSLKAFCENNNLPYKSIHCTTMNKSHSCQNRYIAFKLESWEKLSEEQKNRYISGEYIKQIEQINAENHVKVASKSYIVEFPDGHKETVNNLDRFAREHNINGGNLHASINNTKKASGYKAYKLD